jgi:hypothetical protein
MVPAVIDVMKKEVEEKRRGGDQEKGKEDAGAGDKSNWMSTAQLWTGDSGRCDDASEVGSCYLLTRVLV